MKLGSTSITAGASFTTVDTTIFSQTVTADGAHDIKITVIVPQVSSTVTGDRVHVSIMEGSTVLQRYYIGMPANGWGGTLMAISNTPFFSTPSAGSHTYKVNCVRDVGTGTITWFADNVNAPSILEIEQVY